MPDGGRFGRMHLPSAWRGSRGVNAASCFSRSRQRAGHDNTRVAVHLRSASGSLAAACSGPQAQVAMARGQATDRFGIFPEARATPLVEINGGPFCCPRSRRGNCAGIRRKRTADRDHDFVPATVSAAFHWSPQTASNMGILRFGYHVRLVHDKQCSTSPRATHSGPVCLHRKPLELGFSINEIDTF